ncbi:MAG: hypothetical protein ACXAAM_04320 [Candidatus Heimdallarchaeaceae archaeon]|jgi:hypothetical protein
MSKFQIYDTEELITLESKTQAVAIIGFSVYKMENSPKKYLSQKILNYLNSFEYTYVTQITHASIRFFLFVPANSAGDVIEKVSILLSKIDRMGQIDPFLVFTPLNHTNIATSIKALYQEPMKRTEDPRIIRIDSKWLVFSSFSFSEFEKNSARNYIKDLLSYQPSTLNLSNYFSTQKKRKKPAPNMMFLHMFSSYEEGAKFLIHLEKISKRYKQKLSFSLRFHPYNEVKRRKVLFLFGLTNWSKDSFNWSDMINIEEYIPYLSSYKKHPLQMVQTIETKAGTVNTILEVKQEQIKSQTEKGSEKQQEETPLPPIFPYGLVVTEEDIKKLVKNIPAPPT